MQSDIQSIVGDSDGMCIFKVNRLKMQRKVISLRCFEILN